MKILLNFCNPNLSGVESEERPRRNRRRMNNRATIPAWEETSLESSLLHTKETPAANRS
jgi:hypothetical protein